MNWQNALSKKVNILWVKTKIISKLFDDDIFNLWVFKKIFFTIFVQRDKKNFEQIIRRKLKHKLTHRLKSARRERERQAIALLKYIARLYRVRGEKKIFFCKQITKIV